MVSWHKLRHIEFGLSIRSQMKLWFLLFLLSPSLALAHDPEPRKANIVTRFLGQILKEVFEQLSTEGVSVPLLDLKEAGNFSSIKATASGLTNYLNGVGSHGFQMRVNASKGAVCGNYHLVYLDVPGLFPFFGKGNFRVEIEEINFGMTLRASRDFGTGKFNFNLTDFNAQVPSSKVMFDNLMDDPNVADFLNELLSNLLPQLVPVIAERLKEEVLPPLIDEYGNGFFDCLKEEDIRKCIKDLFIKDKFLPWNFA